MIFCCCGSCVFTGILSGFKRYFMISKICAVSIILFLLVGCHSSSEIKPGVKQKAKVIDLYDFKTFYRIAKSSSMNMTAKEAWYKHVPQIREVGLRSTADGKIQKVLFYNSGTLRKKPLLVALHSWSENYYQQYSIPYGMWAVRNDWVMIHPDYRGKFIGPESTASELAVQDVLDAVTYAKQEANIDESRIYITGFSGGGMMTLIMVGRFPEMWTAAVAWVPVYDLNLWYETTLGAEHDYSKHIANSCGGVPAWGTDACLECKKRSVSTYLANANGKEVKVMIAAGSQDVYVPAGHAIMAFNDLAKEGDYIPQEDIAYINANRAIPDHMQKAPDNPLYSDAGMKLLYQKSSGNAILNIFEGNHDVIYNAGLCWLNNQQRVDKSEPEKKKKPSDKPKMILRMRTRH